VRIKNPKCKHSTIFQHPVALKYHSCFLFHLKCNTLFILDVRYKEHIHAIGSNDSNSGYSNHVLNMGHTYGTITDTMDVIRTGRKGRHLNTPEKYHIYKIVGTTYT
jgi:hypothetical protein